MNRVFFFFCYSVAALVFAVCITFIIIILLDVLFLIPT